MTTGNHVLVGKFYHAFPALSYKNYRYFWLGQCISLMGTWMQRTAQQWLVYSLTKSALLLGILGVAQFGPMLLFSLFAGVMIDRYSKKIVLIFTQTVLMLQALALAALVWSGHVRYWNVLVLAALLGFTNTLDMPARQSFVVNLVEKKHLTNGIALNSTVMNMARIVGPALSAVLMVRFGAGLCFFINGISFIPVIFGLSMITVQVPEVKQKQDKILTATLDGLKYIRSSPAIFFPMLAVLAVGIFAMNYDVIVPVFSDRVLHQGVSGYGFLLSASGFGSMAGALVVAVRNNPSRKLLYSSGLMLAVSMAAAFFVHSYKISIADITLIGFFSLLFISSVNSIIQLNVDDKFRGRVMSVYSLSLMGTTPLGNFFAGLITERYGPGVGFLVCGVVTGVLIACSFNRVDANRSPGKHQSRRKCRCISRSSGLESKPQVKNILQITGRNRCIRKPTGQWYWPVF